MSQVQLLLRSDYPPSRMQSNQLAVCRICAPHANASKTAVVWTQPRWQAGRPRTFGSSARAGALDKSKYILTEGGAKFPKGFKAAVRTTQALFTLRRAEDLTCFIVCCRRRLQE